MDGLTEKQIRFVEAYLIDPNGTKAAIEAGYSEATAGKQAYQLLEHPRIREAIDKARSERRERARLKADDIIYELEKIAKPDIRTLYDDSGRLKRIKEMSADEAGLINELSMTEFGPKVKLYDRLKALDMLSKHHGLYGKTEDPEKKDDPLDKLVDAIKESRERADGVGDIQP